MIELRTDDVMDGEHPNFRTHDVMTINPTSRSPHDIIYLIIFILPTMSICGCFVVKVFFFHAQESPYYAIDTIPHKSVEWCLSLRGSPTYQASLLDWA